MELLLLREYKPSGTNGLLSLDGVQICYTIELPWKNNRRKVSCIPEGRYRLRKRYSQQRNWHLELMDVPARSLILIHAANDALKELQGCIAPVSMIIGEGKGSESRKALVKVNHIVFSCIHQDKPVFLTIKQK